MKIQVFLCAFASIFSICSVDAANNTTITRELVDKANKLLSNCATKSLTDCINKANPCALDDLRCRCDKLGPVGQCYRESRAFDSKKCNRTEFLNAADIRGLDQKLFCDVQLNNKTNTTNTTNPEIQDPDSGVSSVGANVGFALSVLISAAAFLVV